MKLAVLIWIMLATALAGTALTVVLVVPALAAKSALYIPLFCTAAVLAAIPLSSMIAKSILQTTRSGGH